jgi:hypothetical protein
MKRLSFVIICGSILLALAGGAFAQEQDNPADIGRLVKQYKAELLRDPFLNPFAEKKVVKEETGEPTKPLPSLTVQGVIWGGLFPQAIINNRVVKEGDNIDGVLISKISQEGITASYGGVPFDLSSPAQAGSAKSKTETAISPESEPEPEQNEGGSDEEGSY